MLNSFHNPDVLTCLANLSSDEVFTPPNIANQMLDTLPTELWSDKTVTFLDPVSKSGVFLREITKRLIKGLENEFPDIEERIQHILKKQVFGLGITELTSEISRRTLYCSKKANGEYSIVDFSDEEGNLKYIDSQHFWADGVKCKYCGVNKKLYQRNKGLESYAYSFIHEDKPEELFNMKFDVIIGNPPYQMMDGGAQASAIPIYQHFVKKSKRLKPSHLIMITPSRWFSGGRGLHEFRKEMLNDKSIRELHDFIDASECFPGVEIKGGVSFFHWDKNYKGKCKFVCHENNKKTTSERYLKNEFSDILIRSNDAINVLEKILAFKEDSITNLLSAQRPFGFRTFYKGEKESVSKKIKVYVNKGIGYCSEKEVLVNNQMIKTHKVIIPRAIGSGISKADIIKPIYSEPGSCCSETYICFGPFDSEEKAKNAICYINTRFFHFLVNIQKNTMMAPKSVYSFVPMQNFKNKWTDKELFKKYNLSKQDIEIIVSLTNDSLEIEA
jgi:site-specific DNA-methyltransferase (adenine-specific)